MKRTRVAMHPIRHERRDELRDAAIAVSVTATMLGFALVNLPLFAGLWVLGVGVIPVSLYLGRVQAMFGVARWVMRMLVVVYAAAFVWATLVWDTSSTGAVVFLVVPILGSVAVLAYYWAVRERRGR